MKIKIKYSTSEGPHLIDVTLAEIQNMISTGDLIARQPTPKGHKEITFSGTNAELAAMAQAFQKAADNL